MGSAWRIAVSVVHRCSSLRTPSSPGASRTGVGRCMAVGGGTPSGWNREYLSPHSPPHLPLSSHKRPPLPHPPYPRLRRTSTPSSRPPPIQRPAVTCRSPSQALSAGASRRSGGRGLGKDDSVFGGPRSLRRTTSFTPTGVVCINWLADVVILVGFFLVAVCFFGGLYRAEADQRFSVRLIWT